MQKSFSLSTYLAVFAAGGVLAALGLMLYTMTTDAAAPAEQQRAQATAVQVPAGPSSASPTAMSDTTELPAVTVYKRPSCSCCARWVKHMEAAGFSVQTHDRPNMAAKKNELGVPPGVRSCHTAQVGNYVVEGHVPAADVKRLLTEAPATRGLAVPGMPIGSPGMEMPGRPAQPYQVVTFANGGATGIFAQH